MKTKLHLIPFLTLGLLAMSWSARSQTFFTANFTGDQENPAVATAATGTGAFLLTDTGLVFFISVEGLTMTAAHFHTGAIGVNGGVVRGITSDFTGNTARGVWRSTDAMPFTPALRDALLDGGLYVNVHTAANPGGEIRGQVLPSAGLGFSMEMDGAQEVPAVATAATGTGSFTLTEEGLIFRLTRDSLSISAGHFHNAPAGVNGGVVRTITGDFTGFTAEGVWRPSDPEPLTPTLIAELMAGNLYINLHTAAHPGGEIRGQVLPNAGTTFTAAFTGDQENPAVASPATGTGTFEFTSAGLEFDITFQGLTMTAAHFHAGATGANGGVVHAITPEFSGRTASGTWTPAEGLTPSLIDALFAGDLYVNIHTAANPGGEIRGQLQLSSGQGFTGRYDGSQEVPPVATAAMGTGSATLTPEGLVFHMTIDSLPFTASHFHNAIPLVNGPVVRDVFADFGGGNTAFGVWRPTDGMPLTPDLMTELHAGNIYFNAHTAAFPGGEIRGPWIGSGALQCDATNPPTGLSHVTLASRTELHWQPFDLAVACQVNGQRLPTGPSPNRNVLDAPYDMLNAPHSATGPGTTWTWRVRCACSYPPNPLVASPFTAFEDTFSVPVLRRPQVVDAILWPNPAQGEIHLEHTGHGPAAFEVIDMLGRRVDVDGPARVDNPGTVRFGLTGLAEGNYFLRIGEAGASHILPFSVTGESGR